MNIEHLTVNPDFKQQNKFLKKQATSSTRSVMEPMNEYLLSSLWVKELNISADSTHGCSH